MSTPQPTQTLLPHAAPASGDARLVLFAIRRMAAGGLADAFAANAFLAAFGGSYRRPLTMLRALMVELCRIAAIRLMVAPCCSGRLSADEQALLEVLGMATTAPEAAHRRLCAMLHVHNCLAALSGAQAVAQSFADLGRPLEITVLDCN